MEGNKAVKNISEKLSILMYNVKEKECINWGYRGERCVSIFYLLLMHI